MVCLESQLYRCTLTYPSIYLDCRYQHKTLIQRVLVTPTCSGDHPTKRDRAFCAITPLIHDAHSLRARCFDGVDDLLDNARVRQLRYQISLTTRSVTGKAHTVEISPSESSSPARIFRRIRRMILPDRVLGKSSTMKTALGAANGPMDLRTWVMRSFRTWSLDSLPSLRATNALTAWPVSSSLVPTTAASATWSTRC